MTPASFVEGEGCQPFNVTFEGRAAVVPRGTCTFVVKARHAQAAGASALVVPPPGLIGPPSSHPPY